MDWTGWGGSQLPRRAGLVYCRRGRGTKEEGRRLDPDGAADRRGGVMGRKEEDVPIDATRSQREELRVDSQVDRVAKAVLPARAKDAQLGGLSRHPAQEEISACPCGHSKAHVASARHAVDASLTLFCHCSLRFESFKPGQQSRMQVGLACLTRMCCLGERSAHPDAPDAERSPTNTLLRTDVACSVAAPPHSRTALQDGVRTGGKQLASHADSVDILIRTLIRRPCCIEML
ncbi:hypothetical protein L1887_49933 [Cichorium endivia]|nr:hypothetical protein L1887_49933 [Cichorium endivia]